MGSDMPSDTTSYRLRINGVEHAIESSDSNQPLLYGLRALGLYRDQIRLWPRPVRRVQRSARRPFDAILP